MAPKKRKKIWNREKDQKDDLKPREEDRKMEVLGTPVPREEERRCLQTQGRGGGRERLELVVISSCREKGHGAGVKGHQEGKEAAVYSLSTCRNCSPIGESHLIVGRCPRL